MNFSKIFVNEKVLGVLIVCIAFAALARYALIPKRVLVFCDQKIPQSLQKIVQQTIEQDIVRCADAKAIKETLQALCPSVQTVHIDYKASREARTTIKAHVPRLRIISSAAGQKEYVICNDKTVIEKKFFDEYVLNDLPLIHIKANDSEKIISDPLFIDTITMLSLDVLLEYKIIWVSKTEIQLQSLDGKRRIIADVSTVHDNSRYSYIADIVSGDLERYAGGIKADIRLKDQIICSPYEIQQ